MVNDKSSLQNETIFTVEEKFNRHNYKVYAHSSWESAAKIQRVERSNYTASVIVW